MESKRCRSLYIQKVQTNLSLDPKSFLRYIKDLKTDCGIPGIMEFEDKSLTEGYDNMSNLFEHFFSPAYPTNYLNINYSFYIMIKSILSICYQISTIY